MDDDDDGEDDAIFDMDVTTQKYFTSLDELCHDGLSDLLISLLSLLL